MKFLSSVILLSVSVRLFPVPAHSSFDGELFIIISTTRPKKVMPRDAKEFRFVKLGANINFLDLFLPSTSVGDPDPYVFGPPDLDPLVI